jgi:hypothetical protein
VPVHCDLLAVRYLAARALCQSLDLASGGRERVLDRDLDVHVAPVIGRLVADHDKILRGFLNDAYEAAKKYQFSN